MEDKVFNYIREYNMIEDNDTVLVGLSGGADSVCLFTVLLNLSKRIGFKLCCVHLNHMIRGDEAERDAQYCEYICKKHDIPFAMVKEDVPKLAKSWHMSEEEAGRKARYDTFYRMAKEYGATKIAVAHHMNDRAETVLYNLFRGSGVRGLSGIKPVNGMIIRPLLCVNRQEIEHYLKDNKILYMTDSTNETEDYMRNRIRNRVLPYAVMNINENSIENINQAARLCNAAEIYISKEAEKSFEKCVNVNEKTYEIDIEAFSQLDYIIKTYIVRNVLERIYTSLKDISMNHIDSVVSLADMQVSKKISLPKGIIARRDYDKLVLCGQDEKPSGEIKKPPQYQIEKILWESGREIPKNDYTKYFDYDKIKSNLVQRYRQPGDYLVVDAKGSKKKLKDYFIDEKIPSMLRDSIPVFADGNHILWVVGYRISEEYKVSDTTKNVLKITVDCE